jgi:carboxypeptidase C (cathepsin A)
MRFFVLLAVVLAAAPCLAEPAAPPEPTKAEAAGRQEVRPPLPAESVSHHTLSLPASASAGARTLHFTAAAGAFRLTDAKGQPEADIGYIAYTLDDADARTRPVAFAFNGGPGASSAWLQLGAIGPWRLALAGTPGPSTEPLPQPNAETWLDFPDLVFIDPPGTGYSRLASAAKELQEKFYSVE